MERALWFKRKAKGLFLKFKLHKIFRHFEGLFLNTAYLSKFSEWKSNHSNPPFNDFYLRKFDSQKRDEVYDFLFKHENLESPIDYLEFGVYSGRTFYWWLNHNTHKDSEFHGFDTFTGLPEKWDLFNAGDMSVGGQIPSTDDSRAFFYKGLFQETLHPFLENYGNKNRKVIHLDADLYSSTLFVLTQLWQYLKKDDILIFDEYGVPLHEFRAFEDFCKSFYLEYEVIYAGNNYFQLAVKITNPANFPNNI